MPFPEHRRRSGDADESAAAPRPKRRDRISALSAAAALLLAVALLAVPWAVDSWLESTEMPGEPTTPSAGMPAAASVAPLDAVSAILSPSASGPKPDPAAMARRLGALGASAIPVVVGMLCGEIPLPQVEEGTWDQPIHAEALARREQVLLESLRHFRSKDVVEHLRGQASSLPYEGRLVCARLLGEVATLDAQAALLELLERFDPAELEREYARTILEGALTRCVTHDPAALRELSKRLSRIDTSLLPVLARAIGRTRGPRSAEFLARLLGRSAALDVLAMSELARVSESSGIALSDSALSDVRRLLDHDDGNVQRTAITLLGRAGDRQSFDALLTRLGAKDRMVSAAARWSLRTFAGKDLGAAPQPWLDWRDEQDAWWTTRYDAVREQLDSGESAVVFSALRELSERTYFRHEISADIGPFSIDERLELALPAISALERLGSTQAGPWLVRALEFDDARRAPAAAVLRKLFGSDLPAEHAVWARAIADIDR